MPKNDRVTWDAEMLAIAAGMKRAGFSAPAIAKRLGINAKAVKNKMSKVGAKRRLDGRPGNRGIFPVGSIGIKLMDVTEEEQTND